MPLLIIPEELQYSIIRLLDPISLISVSQTSTHFRHLISPSRRHFLEPLLVLKTPPKYGGASPLFDPWNNSLDPPYDESSWSTMRWACTGCRRLLPHEHFDNHSLIKLAYRKPVAAVSINDLPVTTWEPSPSLMYPPRAKGDEIRPRDGKQRQQYFICVTKGRGNLPEERLPVASRLDVLQDCEMEGSQEMTQAVFDAMADDEVLEILRRNAWDIEHERAGYKRHLRKCNECRHQMRRIPSGSPGVYGSAQFPIIASRQIQYGLPIDRWFPGFSDGMEHKSPGISPLLSLIHREDARSQLFTMFMARCRLCTRWQELREFRIGGTFQHWKPNLTMPYEHGGCVMWSDGRRNPEILGERPATPVLPKSTVGRSWRTPS